MSESTSSFLILLGSALVLALLWYLSFVFVRRDTARRGLRPLHRKAWLAAAVGLPLFGFALYLFAQILQGYFKLPEEEWSASAEELPEELPSAVELPEARKPGHTTDVKRPQGHGLTAAAVEQPSAVELPGGTVPGKGRAEVYDTQPGRSTPRTVGAFQPPPPWPPLRGEFELLIVQGPHAGEQLALTRLPLRIGRGPGASLALEADLNVSREHAEIYEWGGALRVRDAGSTHGTQVNGVPVSDQAIHPGDRIHAGGTTIILRQVNLQHKELWQKGQSEKP